MFPVLQRLIKDAKDPHPAPWWAGKVHTACSNGLSVESMDLCAPPLPAHPTSMHFRNWPGRRVQYAATEYHKPALESQRLSTCSALLRPITRTVTGTQGSNRGSHSPAPLGQRALQAPSQLWVPRGAWTGHLSKSPGQGRVLGLRRFWKVPTGHTLGSLFSQCTC